MIQHFYEKIDGWFSYPDVYAHVVTNSYQNRQYKFVEVGSWKGKSTAFMATEILNSKKDILFYAVDTWRGSEEHRDMNDKAYEPLLEKDELYDTFIKNTLPVHKAIFPIRMESLRAAKLFDDESLDFVMIDAAHDYENVLNDIKAWYPKIKKKGMIAGDDLDWGGTKKAVEECFQSEYYEAGGKIWAMIKP